MLDKGLQMNPPKPEFILGEVRNVNDRLEVDGPTTTPLRKCAAENAQFPNNKFAAFPGCLLCKIREPIIKIPRKTQTVPGSPPANFLVTGICGRAIKKSNKRHFLAAGMQLPSHLVSDVAAETIAAEVIWAARLKRAQFLHIASGHVFNARKFLAPGLPRRFDAVYGLIT